MLVAIGSTNPCKIAAVRSSFGKIWPRTRFKSLKVDSEIAAQPMKEEETIRGAINRAQKAISSAQADFGVGIEGGVRTIKGSLFTTAYCSVIDKKGRLSLGGGLIMPLPKEVSDKILAGGELGPVMDETTGIKDIKKKMGAVGILTKNLVDRTKAYEVIISYALVKFLNPKIYFS